MPDKEVDKPVIDVALVNNFFYLWRDIDDIAFMLRGHVQGLFKHTFHLHTISSPADKTIPDRFCPDPPSKIQTI
jgi:hypothetical protein